MAELIIGTKFKVNGDVDIPREERISVAAFTGGSKVPGARFRVRQYIPSLEGEGVDMHELSSPLGQYPPESKWLRPAWGLGSLATNLPRVLESWMADVTLLQREMLSTLVTMEPFTRAPRVLDVDDAIFMYHEGRSAQRLARLSDTVICGNAYLGDWFSRFNGRIEILPTAVDTDRYVMCPQPKLDGTDVVLGWIGTSANLKYLEMVEEPIHRILAEFPQVKLRVISDRPPELKTLPGGRWEFHSWAAETEISQIQGMDIGLMPLEDSLWARGKCSFKMLQYMSCGVPVVVSPVGMNLEVLNIGEVGFGPRHLDEWVDALAALILDDRYRHRLGVNGRTAVESHFSVKSLAPKFASILKRASGRS